VSVVFAGADITSI